MEVQVHRHLKELKQTCAGTVDQIHVSVHRPLEDSQVTARGNHVSAKLGLIGQ